jgi:hypothetical protein
MAVIPFSQEAWVIELQFQAIPGEKQDLFWKIDGGVTQELEHLPNKYKAWVEITVPAKKKKKNQCQLMITSSLFLT